MKPTVTPRPASTPPPPPGRQPAGGSATRKPALKPGQPAPGTRKGVSATSSASSRGGGGNQRRSYGACWQNLSGCCRNLFRRKNKFVYTRKGRLLMVLAAIVTIFMLGVGGYSIFVIYTDLEGINDESVYYVPAIVHLTCCSALLLTVVYDMIVMIWLQLFDTTYGHISFFIVCLTEMIMAVNSLTLEYKDRRLFFIIGSFILFVLFVIFTLCLSNYYENYQDESKRILEREFLILISRDKTKSKVRFKDCITVAMTRNVSARSSYASANSRSVSPTSSRSSLSSYPAKK